MAAQWNNVVSEGQHGSFQARVYDALHHPLSSLQHDATVLLAIKLWDVVIIIIQIQISIKEGVLAKSTYANLRPSCKVAGKAFLKIVFTSIIVPKVVRFSVTNRHALHPWIKRDSAKVVPEEGCAVGELLPLAQRGVQFGTDPETQ